MKSHSSALATLLNSGEDFEHADIWTIVLHGGSVLRWSGADIPLVWAGQTFSVGPGLQRGSIQEGKGLSVTTLTVRVTADEEDTVFGTPLIEFIRKRKLDGASIRLERAFMSSWGQPVVGTVLRFAGKVTSISDIEGNGATVTVSSWTILLNTGQPNELYQTGCLNSLYSVGCGLNKNDWEVTGTVASGSITETSIPTDLSAPAGWYSQGRIVFTSGVLSGLSRTIRRSSSGGDMIMANPLPALPSPGDTIAVLPGCDLLMGTCMTKFNNLAHFRGQPFVPVPEMAV